MPYSGFAPNCVLIAYEMAQASITGTVSWNSLVISSTIVMAINGACVAAVSTAAMPITTSERGSPTHAVGSHSAATCASTPPALAPTNSDGVNMPPMAPLPELHDVAITLVSSTSASHCQVSVPASARETTL